MFFAWQEEEDMSNQKYSFYESQAQSGKENG